jgi:hypothetical protein
MKREDIFEAARVAEFIRVSECCPGVELKLCSNDQWKGDLGAFVTQIEMRVIQCCIDFINNGSFLSDDSPPKRFANEVTAEMKRQLMPMFELSPEMLREMMRPLAPIVLISVEGTSTEDPGTIKLGAKYGDARGVSEVPFVREDAAPITYAQAIELFKPHLTSHLLKTDKSPEEIVELLAAEAKTPTQEIRAIVDRLLKEANERGGVKVGRRPQSEYSFGHDRVMKVYITDTPEVGEDGIRKND